MEEESSCDGIFCLLICSPHAAFGHSIIVFIFSIASLLMVLPTSMSNTTCLLTLKPEASCHFCFLFSLLFNHPLLLYLQDLSNFLLKYLLNPPILNPTILLLPWLRELAIEYFHSFVYCFECFLFFHFITEQRKPIKHTHTQKYAEEKKIIIATISTTFQFLIK